MNVLDPLHNAIATDILASRLLLSGVDPRYGGTCRSRGAVFRASGASDWLSGNYSERKNRQFLQEARLYFESR